MVENNGNSHKNVPNPDPDPDVEIARLARRQYGHVTRAQLLRIGLASMTIQARVESGRLIPVHAGVYAVGHVPIYPLARAAAAVLACGPGALLSHRSAASLWGIYADWEFPIEVTVDTRRRRPRIDVHRCTTLAPADRRRTLGIAVTSPARTLLDLAPPLPDRGLGRMIDDARHERLTTTAQLRALLERCPTHPGARRCRAIVGDPAGPTRSEFEARFIAFARAHDLPTPRVNANLDGREVDVLFEAERLIVELDSWEFHRHRRAFEADRERDARHLEAGYVTLRITWKRLCDHPRQEAARLDAVLRSRRELRTVRSDAD